MDVERAVYEQGDQQGAEVGIDHGIVMGRWIISKICDTHAWECHQETQYSVLRIYANNKEDIREERKKGLTMKDSTDCRDQKEGQCSTSTVGSYINSNEYHASVTNYNAAFSHMKWPIVLQWPLRNGLFKSLCS